MLIFQIKNIKIILLKWNILLKLLNLLHNYNDKYINEKYLIKIQWKY